VTLGTWLLICVGVFAQSPRLDDQVRSQLEEAIGRLELTEAQKEKVRPILRTGIEQRLAIFSKHGLIDEEGRRAGSAPSLRELRAIRGELDTVQAGVTQQLTAVLTANQMDQYRKIQDEVRETLRQRVREGRR
jgi:hypothetical protein